MRESSLIVDFWVLIIHKILKLAHLSFQVSIAKENIIHISKKKIILMIFKCAKNANNLNSFLMYKISFVINAALKNMIRYNLKSTEFNPLS